LRIHIDHATTYAYDRPARFIIQTLRLTPRSSEAQQVRHWGVETDVDARLRRSEDAFGNVVHTLYTEQPTSSLTVRVTGEVLTSDTAGVVPPDQETLVPQVFLRDTPLTRRDNRSIDSISHHRAPTRRPRI
jgi:transglutaminase-like putative cysteine protease